MLIHVYWMRLLVMVGYVFLIFAFSRVIDIFSYYYYGVPRIKVIEPVALNAHHMRQIFDNRQINYTLPVKMDSADLVTQEEVKGLSADDIRKFRSVLSPSRHVKFMESLHQTEDSADDIWLIRVEPCLKETFLLREITWKSIYNYIIQHSIRIGTFDCAADMEFCESVSWRKPLLLLVLPKGSKKKLALKEFYMTKQEEIFEWVREQLSVHVTKVDASEELERNWLNTTKYSLQEIKLVFFTQLEYIPTYFATNSLRFLGQVKFGMYRVKAEDFELLNEKINDFSSPAYLILTKNYTAIFTRPLPNEFRSVFLKILKVEGIDIFSFSLIVVNMLAAVKIFQTKENTYSVWWEIGRILWILMSYNFRTFVMLLFMICIMQLSIVKVLTEIIIVTMHAFALTSVGARAIMDYQILYDYPSFFVITFLLYSFLFTQYLRKYTRLPTITIENLTENSWIERLQLDVLFSDSLFRRVMMLAHPEIFQGSDESLQMELDERMNNLMSRITAVPHLWLQPALITLNNAYIKNLPTWNFRTQGEEEMDAIKDLMDGVTEKTTNSVGPEKSSNTGKENKKKNSSSWNTRQHCKCKKKQSEGGKRPCLKCLERQNDEDETPIMNEERKTIYVPECAICLESYESGAILCGLPCRHNFHKDCIVAWLERDNYQCPICRWPAYENEHNSRHSCD